MFGLLKWFTTLQPRTPVLPLQTRLPAPCVEPLRVSSTKLRLAQYALFLTPPSQIPAHQHLIHRIVAFKTGKMPHETVFRTKVQINWADSENFSQLVSRAVQLSPKKLRSRREGCRLTTHHLAHETSTPGFRRLFLLL